MSSIWQLAGMTAAVGMGVVFVALFLLSLYMHYFKLLTARLEKAKRAPPPAAPKRAKPVVAPVPDAAPTAPVASAGDAPVAAAVAVGLYLRGVLPTAREEVAAAIAAALALRRRRLAASGPSVPRSPANWRLAGRLDAMHGRRRGQERPLPSRR